jgi:hypothetical protein
MASEGPKNPTEGSSVAGTGGVYDWPTDGTFIASAFDTDDVYVNNYLDNGVEATQTLNLYGFDFASVTGTVDSVTVTVEGKAQTAGRTVLGRVWLANAGTIIGSADETSNALTETDQVFTYNSWGVMPSAAVVVTDDFQVRLQVLHVAASGASTVYIDHVTVTVTYTPGGGGGSAIAAARYYRSQL